MKANPNLNGKLIPLKTNLEKIFWPAIWELSSQGKYYVMVEDLTKSLQINKRSVGGVVASLQKKGWIFAFSNQKAGLDLEITCLAQKEMGIKKTKRFCNHQGCICNLKFLKNIEGKS